MRTFCLLVASVVFAPSIVSAQWEAVRDAAIAQQIKVGQKLAEATYYIEAADETVEYMENFIIYYPQCGPVPSYLLVKGEATQAKAATHLANRPGVQSLIAGDSTNVVADKIMHYNAAKAAWILAEAKGVIAVTKAEAYDDATQFDLMVMYGSM